MASIFDAYAQAYDKSLNQEAKMADALRVANLARQQQEIQQAQENRRAQRFNFELQRLQAETPNAVAEQRIRGLLLNNPEYANAFTSGNLARAQAGATEAQAQYQGLLGLGPNLSRAYQAPYLKGANAADELEIMSALRGSDPARVTALTGVANPVRGSDMLWRSPDGKILQPNPLASLMANRYTGGLQPSQQPRHSTVNDVASMAGRQAVRKIDNAIDARQPVPPVTPIMPTPAVTATPSFGAQSPQQPVQNLGGGLNYDPMARERFMQPLRNMWGGLMSGAEAGLDFLGSAASSASPVPALSPDWEDWVQQRPRLQYGIRPDVNFPNSPFNWMNQGR